MPRPLHVVVAFTSALVLGTLLGADSRRAHADSAIQVSEAPPPPHDPKKKNDGDPCKDASECQTHHSCTKVGDKNVCKAPAPRRLPPGAVT